jgi:hypothetical protein
MNSGELARQLGKARDAFGVVEGAALAMRESVEREVADDHFSQRFFDRLERALEDAREAIDSCYDAVDVLPRGVGDADEDDDG